MQIKTTDELQPFIKSSEISPDLLAVWYTSKVKFSNEASSQLRPLWPVVRHCGNAVYKPNIY